MRFVEGWDSKLLGMLSRAERSAQHGRAVLSAYPPGYQARPPLPPMFCICCAAQRRRWRPLLGGLVPDPACCIHALVSVERLTLSCMAYLSLALYVPPAGRGRGGQAAG